MNWDLYLIDSAVLAILVIIFYRGVKRGVINQAVWFGSFVVGYLVGAWFSYDLADVVGFTIYNKNVSMATAFILIFSSVVTGMYYLGKYLTKIVNLSVIGLLNSILGGLLNSLVYIVIVISLSNVVLFLMPKADKYLDKTISFSELVKFEKWLMDQNYIDDLKNEIEDVIEDEIKDLT